MRNHWQKMRKISMGYAMSVTQEARYIDEASATISYTRPVHSLRIHCSVNIVSVRNNSRKETMSQTT